ncbi:aminopeptidase P family protein [Mesorhizobium sp. B2-7-1]|nr:aminopeptidase P family protein [Mesorhizobium sp. B2-7-1]
MTMIARNFEVQKGTEATISKLPFSNEEYERRLEALRREMRTAGVDVFISFGPENIFYLTGHDTPAYQYVQACVVTMDATPINVIRHIDASNTLYNSWSKLAVGYQDEDEPISAIFALVQQVAKPDATIGLEDEAFFVSPKRYAMLTGLLQGAGYKTTATNPVGTLRLTKSAEEISCIRRAARISEKAMAAAIGAAGEGVNENFIAAEVWRVLVGNGGEFPGLPPFVTSGPRMCLAHATWSGRQLQAGDSLGFEIPGVVNRYVAPIYRCGTIGKPNAGFEKLAEACITSLEVLTASIKPGAVAADIHQVHVDNFSRYKLIVDHRTGYSVGVNYAPDWGEGNELSITRTERRELKPGMVFHLVPGVFIDDRTHITISETVLVTETGCEVITQYPRPLFIV